MIYFSLLGQGGLMETRKEQLMRTKYAKNENGERYHYSEQDRKEILRGTSWYDPKYLNFTEKQYQAEIKRKRKLLKKRKTT